MHVAKKKNIYFMGATYIPRHKHTHKKREKDAWRRLRLHASPQNLRNTRPDAPDTTPPGSLHIPKTPAIPQTPKILHTHHIQPYPKTSTKTPAALAHIPPVIPNVTHAVTFIRTLFKSPTAAAVSSFYRRSPSLHAAAACPPRNTHAASLCVHGNLLRPRRLDHFPFGRSHGRILAQGLHFFRPRRAVFRRAFAVCAKGFAEGLG